jgi:hypothetical protein
MKGMVAGEHREREERSMEAGNRRTWICWRQTWWSRSGKKKAELAEETVNGKSTNMEYGDYYVM